jgi:putative membrane protein
MRISTRSSLFMVGLLCSAAATAQDAAPPSRINSNAAAAVSGQPISAKTFIEKASQDGMAEVKVAALAQQKSPSQDVRQFAAQMQRDHGKANAELQTIASSKHVTVATELDSEHQRMVADLSGKTGPAFDAAYASHMVVAHNQAVALFKSGSQSSDADIARFATKTLPTLEHHQGMANEMVSKRKLAAAGAPGVTS